MDEATLQAKVAVQGSKLADMDKKLDQLVHAIIGNGKPGLLMRVDRIEQNEKFRNRLVWFLFAAVLAGIVNFFVERYAPLPEKNGPAHTVTSKGS